MRIGTLNDVPIRLVRFDSVCNQLDYKQTFANDASEYKRSNLNDQSQKGNRSNPVDSEEKISVEVFKKRPQHNTHGAAILPRKDRTHSLPETHDSLDTSHLLDLRLQQKFSWGERGMFGEAIAQFPSKSQAGKLKVTFSGLKRK
jgi:hypothetical protein